MTQKSNILYARHLRAALKQAGLPTTMPNFVYRFENKICLDKSCPNYKKPYLQCPTNSMGTRVFTQKQIDEIIATAQAGWFKRHWHWLS